MGRSRGRDQLTKLTLAILDYAMHDPPTKLSKTVIYYLDEYGLPTNQKQAVGQVTASIGIDERNESLLKVPRGDEARLEQYLNYRLKAIMDREAAARDSAERKTLIEEEQLVRSKMDFLHEQLRIGGLKEQYYNRTSARARRPSRCSTCINAHYRRRRRFPSRPRASRSHSVAGDNKRTVMSGPDGGAFGGVVSGARSTFCWYSFNLSKMAGRSLSSA